jgi:multicomponent Na+:H+ antiporter subunit C
MSGSAFYASVACVLFVLALHALIIASHPLRQLLAINVMGSAVFLVLVATASAADPVPRAMVITGIVVAVAATALGLNLMLKLLTGEGDGEREPP